MTSIAAEIGGYYSPTQLIERFGSTRAAAQAVGVSQRTVQRWITGAKQKAKPGKAAIGKIKAAMGRPQKIKLQGNIRIGSGERDRTIDFPGYHKELTNSQWDSLIDAAASGDTAVWDEMAAIYGVSSMELLEGDIDIS